MPNIVLTYKDRILVNYGIDSDSQAFITAAGLTNITHQRAIAILVKQLKEYGLWTKMKAIYPFVGGTASTHKWNLKDPRDLDAAFRLTFSGGLTHSATGCLPDGSSGYANTYFNPSINSILNSQSMGFYYGTNNVPLSLDPIDMGSYNDGNTESILFYWKTSLASVGSLNSNLYKVVVGCDNRLSLLILSKTANNILNIYKYWNSSILTALNTGGGSLPNIPIYLGTMSYIGVPYSNGYTNNEFRFAFIGDGITNLDSLNLYNIVQAYQIRLNRNV